MTRVGAIEWKPRADAIRLGASNQNALFVNQTNYEFTATKSIFTMSAGGFVDLTVTFLSPVVPGMSSTSYVMHSLHRS